MGRTPDKSAFVMELSDGTVTSPVCFQFNTKPSDLINNCGQDIDVEELAGPLR